VSHKDFILGSLNKADQMEVQGNLQSLLDGYNRINAGIEERSRTLQSYVSQQREIAAKVEESIEFLTQDKRS
jgi:hypothetical protein